MFLILTASCPQHFVVAMSLQAGRSSPLGAAKLQPLPQWKPWKVFRNHVVRVAASDPAVESSPQSDDKVCHHAVVHSQSPPRMHVHKLNINRSAFVVLLGVVVL